MQHTHTHTHTDMRHTHAHTRTAKDRDTHLPDMFMNPLGPNSPSLRTRLESASLSTMSYTQICGKARSARGALRAHTHTHTHTHTHIHVCGYEHTHTHTCVHAPTHAHTHARVLVHMHTDLLEHVGRHAGVHGEDEVVRVAVGGGVKRARGVRILRGEGELLGDRGGARALGDTLCVCVCVCVYASA